MTALSLLELVRVTQDTDAGTTLNTGLQAFVAGTGVDGSPMSATGRRDCVRSN